MNKYVCHSLVPPNIQPVSSNYTAEVGSQITLECSIINQGVPVAQFGWLRNGIDLNGENIFTNNTFIVIELSNITMEDAGDYTCTARSVRWHHSDTITLNLSHKTEGILSVCNIATFIKCCIAMYLFVMWMCLQKKLHVYSSIHTVYF